MSNKHFPGDIFCHEVVVGGCLTTTHELTENTGAARLAERNTFKAAVGIKVGIVCTVFSTLDVIFT